MTSWFRLSLAGLAGLSVWTAAHGDWTGDTPGFLVLWSILVLVYGLVLFSAGLLLHGAKEVPQRDLRWALASLAAVRLVMAFGEPLLSDDVFRSVWEGRVQRASGNPFAWSDRPESEKWTGLRDAAVFPRINHPDYAAIYPPAWQWAMRFLGLISDSVTAVKLFAIGCELLFWAGLAALLRARGQPAGRILIAAASPLALVEISGSGHAEAMGMAALVWTLVHLERGALSRASGALALAVLSKIIPGLLALPWLSKFRIRHFAMMAVIFVALSIPFADPTALWSLRKYGDYWQFNETLFALTASIFGSQRGGIALSAALLLALGAFLGRRGVDGNHAGLIMSIALILLIPNVLPWYALWLLVFLPASRFSPLWAGALVMTLTAPLAYLVYPGWLKGEPWHLSWSVRALEYGVPALVAAATAFFARPRHPSTS